jgi:hypothetical protein
MTIVLVVSLVVGLYLLLTGDTYDYERAALGLLFIVGGLLLLAFKLGQWW